MNDENLQLRNCADCVNRSICAGKEPCEFYEFGDPWDSFDREEDAYND